MAESTTNSNVEDGPKHFRRNVVYRSLRKSTSRVLYSVKKKVSTIQQTATNRKALHRLNESCTPTRFSPYVSGEGKENRLYGYRNPAASFEHTPTSPFVSASPAASVEKRLLSNRASKTVARKKIWEIQSPKRSVHCATPRKLELEVNELAQGIQDLHSLAQRYAPKNR